MPDLSEIPLTDAMVPHVAGARHYEQMTKELKLTEEQQKKIKDICDKMDKTATGLNKKMLEVRRRDLFRGGDFQDPEAAGKQWADLAELVKNRRKVIDDAQADIDKALTADQRADWAAFKLRQAVELRLAWGIELTAEQKQKLGALCLDAGKQLADPKDPTDADTLDAIYGKLWKLVTTTVLTDAQVGKMMGGGKAATGRLDGRGI